ncbi:MAG TPA: UDP-glucose/GDP-mannose dehydrogenase family protein [Bacillota bacterium]|nr:UDP-glucose/GDP-mannose dehydrogenase family protein [Bacillota bacterium]
MKVTIIGCGYVGLTTGVTLAYLGHQVMGAEKDLNKLEMLLQGQSPIHEQGLAELLKLAGARIQFTADIAAAAANAEIIIIAVGTPPKQNGEADLQYVETAAAQVALGLMSDQTCTIVVKSTVPIGANNRVASVVKRVLSSRNIDAKVHFASNPEFLQEGKALGDAFYPDRIIIGADNEIAIEYLRRLYRPILEQTFTPPPCCPRPQNYVLPPLVTTNTCSSEMIKYAANAFLAMKISYINEVAVLCEKVGADVNEVARGIGLDPRIGPRFLQAGIGWGGSCFPKDTSALIALGKEYNYAMPIIEAVRTINIRQRRLIIEKLQSFLKVLRGRTVGILGLTFKPGTDDLRESPAIEIINILLEGGAHIRAHDPIALPNAQKEIVSPEVELIDDPYILAENCDALVLLTEWDIYDRFDFKKLASKMRSPYLLDGRNFLNREELTQAGFIYEGVGR